MLNSQRLKKSFIGLTRAEAQQRQTTDAITEDCHFKTKTKTKEKKNVFVEKKIIRNDSVGGVRFFCRKLYDPTYLNPSLQSLLVSVKHVLFLYLSYMLNCIHA